MEADKILVGIEHEFFIFHPNGEAPSHATSNAVFQQLAGLLGGEFVASTQNDIYGLKYPTDFGLLSIHHEVSTHIVEIAFPPVQNPADFRALYEQVSRAINLALHSADLAIVPGGMILQLPPITFRSVAIHDQARIERRNFWLTLPDNGDPLFTVDFPATIASTQVNLTVPDGVLIPRLPRYYAMEYLTPLLFSTSVISQPVKAHCARLLRYEGCMPGTYRLIPDHVVSIEETGAWGSRDFSAIVPRGNHAEFRTACSQPDASRILQLIGLKLLQHALAMRDTPIPLRNPAKLFREVCHTGCPPVEFDSDLAMLANGLPDLANEWKVHAATFLDSAHGFLKMQSSR